MTGYAVRLGQRQDARLRIDVGQMHRLVVLFVNIGGIRSHRDRNACFRIRLIAVGIVLVILRVVYGVAAGGRKRFFQCAGAGIFLDCYILRRVVIFFDGVLLALISFDNPCVGFRGFVIRRIAKVFCIVFRRVERQLSRVAWIIAFCDGNRIVILDLGNRFAVADKGFFNDNLCVFFDQHAVNVPAVRILIF